jgi:hypothetical protein
MKVRPLKSYHVPTYPTLAEAGSARELLSKIPRRWENSPKFCALIGVGLMVRTLTAGGDVPPSAGSAAPTKQAPNDAGTAPARQEVVQRGQKATSLVAPILAEALLHDGRGATGCIAVNPPTFLSEAEALDLIRNELTAAGLKLEHGVELDGVMAPRPGRPSVLRRAESPAPNPAATAAAGTGTAAPLARPAGEIRMHNWPGAEPELAPRAFVFDLADRNRSVYVEYFSQNDYRTWMGWSASTVQAYDFPALTRKVSEALAKRESDEGIVFGLFFDPLARVEVPYSDATGLDHAQRRMVHEEYHRAQKTAREQIGAKAREKLRRQVRHFVAFLQQEGVIPPPESAETPDQAQGQQAHAPDTPSDESL